MPAESACSFDNRDTQRQSDATPTREAAFVATRTPSCCRALIPNPRRTPIHPRTIRCIDTTPLDGSPHCGCRSRSGAHVSPPRQRNPRRRLPGTSTWRCAIAPQNRECRHPNPVSVRTTASIPIAKRWTRASLQRASSPRGGAENARGHQRKTNCGDESRRLVLTEQALRRNGRSAFVVRAARCSGPWHRGRNHDRGDRAVPPSMVDDPSRRAGSRTGRGDAGVLHRSRSSPQTAGSEPDRCRSDTAGAAWHATDGAGANRNQSRAIGTSTDGGGLRGRWSAAIAR